jgi:arylformamidase
MMALYRNMDRATLDAAYNNSAAVAESADFLADWKRRSILLRERPGVHLDLAYGAAPRNKIDYFPSGKADAPTLLFFHGGYWQGNSREGFAFIADGPLAHGINVAVAGYTLAPEARMDTIVREARSAAHWLGSHLAELGGDPARLFVSGWSAGSHLAVTVLCDQAARGGMAISGIYDLEPIRLNYLNDKLRLDAAEARRNSPLLHLPAKAGPLFVTVGGDELLELRRQSSDFAAAWSAHGLSATFLEVAGCHHYAVLEELARPDGILAESLIDFVA